MNKISYKYLEDLKVFEECLPWFLENFEKKEYSINELIEEIKNKKIKTPAWYISWLMIHCKFARSKKTLKLYMDFNPPVGEMAWFIVNYKFTHTPEMLKFFMKSNPDAEELSPVLAFCEFARIPKMFKLYKKSRPSMENFLWLKKIFPEIESKINVLQEKIK
jgi:hypothetical protein